MAGFQARLHALEGQFAHEEQRLALNKHLERLVAAGEVSADAVAAMKERAARQLSSLPTTVISRPAAERVYQHVKGAWPSAHPALWLHPAANLGSVDAWAQLGTAQISLGRARWETPDGSIFSVADGRRLAQEPVRLPTAFEAARQRKIDRATLGTPLVRGMRLLPVFSPGRALLWGTILAAWGTGAVVASSSRALDIRTAEEAPGRLREVLTPYIAAVQALFEPLRGQLQFAGMRAATESSEFTELARRVRRSLGGADRA